MKKPSGIEEQVWESRVLRYKAHEAHKEFEKARERHEKAEQACRDIPRLNINAYNHEQDTRRAMNKSFEIMAEAYCDYINHKRNIRSEK